ncbi:MAG: HAMP domain-containing sensor histidine kinase [Anaerolineales bacterium]|nr:HAMP domain-containing sensor histidine kinase [Anaerolineales bacterium]
MLRSLQSRLFLTYLIVTAVVLVVLTFSLLLLLVRSPFLDQATFLQLERSLPQTVRGQGQILLQLPQDQLERAVAVLDQRLGSRVILIGPGGEIKEDSRPDETELPREVRDQAVSNRTSSRGRFGNGGDRWLYLMQPLADGNAIVIASPRIGLGTIRVWGDDFMRPVLLAGGIALIVSILLSFLIARWIAAPLDHIAAASRSVASGRYDQHLEVAGPEEIQSVARAFNDMVREVQASQQSQRDFVANVSHELKTPLTSIRGFAQAILDGAAVEPEERDRAVRIIRDESDRLQRLVKDLLDLARLDSGQVEFQFQRVDLNALLAAVIERLSVKARDAQVQIELQIPDFSPLVGDGDRLAQVFTNLLDNAVKHSPAGGLVRIWGEQDSGWVSIHVDDDGAGIPESDLERIFERFYMVNKARPGGADRGTGLGLAISQEIIRLHKGRILAQSKLERGSRFSVQLPVVRPDDSRLLSAHRKQT